MNFLYVPFLYFMILLSLAECCKDEPVTDDVAGSTVSVEVLPESINELITDEINITCTPQDLPLGTQNILFMELGQEGEHPLASMNGPTLKLGDDMKNNMQARGQIIAKNLSESYLQLSIKRPFVDDVGVYCCRMFYQNEFGELKMGHVYSDVTIQNNDKAVFIHLLQKISDLEKTIEDQDAKASFSSAFSVYGTKSERFEDGTMLIFNQFLLNIGNHYDMNTGIFTVPKRGLYAFNLVTRADTNQELVVDLKVNDVAMMKVFTLSTSQNDQSSISAVLSLEMGDKVWPFVSDGATLGLPDDKFTAFSGYLIKQL